jgi:twitching motility protein PilT
MQAGQEKFGMQTFNQALATLYFQKLITSETAMTRSSNPDELQDMINRGTGLITSGARPQAGPVRR